MTDIKNKFYKDLDDSDDIKKFKVLFENFTNSSRQFNELILDEKYNISFNDEINTEPDTINFNEILTEFINDQKNNNVIDLSFIYFRDEIKENFFNIVADKEILFANSIFQKKVYFTNLEFKEKVNFEGSRFKERTNFNRTLFRKECIFESVEFEKEIEFKNTIFYDNAKFSASRFEKFTSFEVAIFMKEVDFENTIAKDLFYFYNVSLGSINLIGSHLDKANFLRLHNNNRDSKVLIKDNLANKDSARILKAHFENENNITEANIYFVLEQEFYLDLLKKEDSKYPNRILNQISLQFNKYVSNYGTDWLRVLIVMFGFGFLVSLFYITFDTDDSFRYIKFTNDELKWQWVGLILSVVLYYLYINNNRLSKLFFFILIAYYIQSIFLYPNLQLLTNNIITLINPLNIFNQDIFHLEFIDKHQDYFIHINYFENIALYGILVKGITITLIYQFIISFRNSTRKK